jgi:uncharacterized membrane protein YphA (DoxX/SURF4 family)
MKQYIDYFDRADEKITSFMIQYGILFLRISLGVIFLWFGVLKFIPGLSPAQSIATITIEQLTFGLINPDVSIIILAVWETLIGLGLIFGIFLRATLFLLFTQLLGTMTPLIFFPAETFIIFPFVPTLEGQYIIKNLVLISAGLVVGATVRGGRIVEERVRGGDLQMAEAEEL